MASRPVWKGFIRFSLVSIPVKAYTAASSDAGRIALNQIHKDCGARIKYQKVCPVHGEVPADQIVSGYQFAEDKYVIIDDDELAKLRGKGERSVDIAHFIDPDEIDSRYHNGRTLYFTPDGVIGRKPYALLHQVMVETRQVAFATGVFNNREQPILIRPIDKLLGATFLAYEQDVKPVAEFEPEVPAVKVEKKEVELARTLVNQLADEKFDFSSYTNKYTANLEKLIEAKVAGKEIVAPPAEEEPQVINLMEALQKSLDEARGKARPPRMVAPSTAQKRSAAGAHRKRKSS